MGALVRFDEGAVCRDGLNLLLQKVAHENGGGETLHGNEAAADKGDAAHRCGVRPIRLDPKPTHARYPQHHQRDAGAERGVGEEEDEEFLIRITHAIVDPGTMVVHTENAPPARLAVVRTRRLPVVVAQPARPRIQEILGRLPLGDGAWVRRGRLEV